MLNVSDSSQIPQFDVFLIHQIRLYGASVIQFYNYCDVSPSSAPTHIIRLFNSVFQRFWKSDKWPLKTVVVAAMVFETAHQIVLLVPTYSYLITGFGNIEELLELKP